MLDNKSEYITRTTIQYANLSKKFTNINRNYTKQYCSIYTIRLQQMNTILLKTINEKWGKKYPIVKIHKLTETDCETCIIIGTLFKDQKLKPSIIMEFSEANQLVPQPILTNFTDESDTLWIEDELQRYQLLGNLNIGELVTGISCALLGKDNGNGKFEVVDYKFADICEQIERPMLEDNYYVVLLSGLDLVNLERTNILLQLLSHWLSGLIHLGDKVDTKSICRVIVAGNSIRTVPKRAKPTISMTARASESADTIEAVKIFDDFLHNLCQVIEVDVMPGENDPSNHILPQQPLHYCMFPKSSKYKSLNQVSNPYKFSLGQMELLGTSGQPVTNISRFCDIKNPLDILECCLKWNHIAPTAPDTLGCFPFYEEDPFILDSCPHVFFVGNQESFGTKVIQGTKKQKVCLISIPEFASSHQVCILNLKNLECFPISFLS